MDETRTTDDPSSSAFDRRRFIKRAAITGAVAVPVVSSFSMTGVNAAFAQQTNVSGRQQGSDDTTTTDGDTSGATDGSTTTTDGSTTTTDGSTTTTDGSTTTTDGSTTTTAVTNQGPTTTVGNQGPTTTVGNQGPPPTAVPNQP